MKNGKSEKADLIISVTLQTNFYINAIKLTLFLLAILCNVHLFNVTGASSISLVIFIILTALFSYHFTIRFETKITIDNIETLLLVSRNFFGASKVSIENKNEKSIQAKTMKKHIYFEKKQKTIPFQSIRLSATGLQHFYQQIKTHQIKNSIFEKQQRPLNSINFTRHR